MRRALYLILLSTVLPLTLGCTGDKTLMLQQLETLEQYNRADSLMLNDSLATILTRYFDQHGNNNERMRAYYILGRTHADRGELPQALAAYQDAIERADTTSIDCDYASLGRIYSQMARLFYQQLLTSNEILARQQAQHYFLCAKDTFYAIYNQGMIAGTYILMNKRDSAEILLRKTMHQYRTHGYEQDALQVSTMLMHLYIDQPDHQFELKQLIDQYDHKSKQFDKQHELSTSKRQFYYYKGKYFEGNNRLDSAEYYYRKIYYPNMSYAAKNPMYKGLLSVFRKLYQADSIAKYSQLYCEVNDSSISIKDQQQTAQLAASYNYHYYKEKSLENENKALWAFIALAITFILLTVLIIGIIYLIKRFRKIQILMQKIHLKREEELLNIHQQEKEELQKIYDQKQEQTKQEYDQKLAQLSLRQEEELTASKMREISKKYFCNEIVVRSIRVANDPHQSLTEKAFNDLQTITFEYFPMMQHEFEQNEIMTTQMKRVCFLSILEIHVDDIGRLLKVSPQRITNLRAELSHILFNKKSARRFESNLRKHFGIRKA